LKLRHSLLCDWTPFKWWCLSISQLSYDEYTDCTLSVGRWDSEGEDWPPALICHG